MAIGKLAVASLVLLALRLFVMRVDAPLSEFQQWKLKHGLVYSPEEDIYREGVYLQNKAKIEQHNLLGKSYKMAINHLAGLTSEEFQKLYLSAATTSTVSLNQEVKAPTGPTIDWQVQGKVTSVKNQGNCEASYSFASVGAIESMSSIYYRAPTELSSQQVIDCSDQYGNQGCFGGSNQNTYQWATDRGIATTTEYPWTGSQQQCRSTSGSFKKTNGYRNITDCDSLALVLAKQPVSVMVDGTNFQFYYGGLYSDCQLKQNTALLLVGMNDQAWRLRGAYGVTWGEDGYIRFYRGNTCGICLGGSYPIPK